MKRQYNLVEFFSGIGSQARALKNLDVEVNTVGTCEWDVHALIAYDIFHNETALPENIASMGKADLLEKLENYTFSNNGKAPLKKESLRTYSKEALQRIYASVLRNKNFVDISSLDGCNLPDNVDILTYSFPCQDLSNVGAFHGYNKGIDKDSGSRSSLLWQVGRILSEAKQCGKVPPRFLLMENVPALLAKRHYDNFMMWKEDLEELGYVSFYYELNASWFGLPQNRPRLLMISAYVGDDESAKEKVYEFFQGRDTSAIVEEYKQSKFYKKQEVQELIRTNYSDQKLLAEAIECTPNNTISRQKIWDDNPKIVLPDGTFNPEIDVIRTITTKQDRNPNSGNLYFDSSISRRAKFRYLTPRECLLFMGFKDDDYDNLKKHNVEFHKGDEMFSRDKIIRMAGNSIPVKLLEGIFWQIIQLDDYMG